MKLSIPSFWSSVPNSAEKVQPLHLEAGAEVEADAGVDGLFGAQGLRPARVRNCPTNRVAASYTSGSGTTVDAPEPQRLDEPSRVDKVLGARRPDQPGLTSSCSARTKTLSTT